MPDSRLPDSAGPDSRLPDSAGPDLRLPDSATLDLRVPDTAVADLRLPDSAVTTCPPPAAGGTCNVFPACGCPAGQVCYPDTPATGLTCETTAGLGEGAACSGKGCASGFGCFGGVCKRYCQSDSDCPAVDTAQSCDSTYWDSTNTIAGVSVCSRVCDPVYPQNPRSPLLACPVGFGCLADTVLPGASDCTQQSGTGDGQCPLHAAGRLLARVLLQQHRHLREVLLLECRLPDQHDVQRLRNVALRRHHSDRLLLLRSQPAQGLSRRAGCG